MRSLRSRLAALLCGLAVLVFAAVAVADPCAEQIDEGGIGGTGLVPEEGGIGGTGRPAFEGGIGGTGSPLAEGGIGGTGIVGVITGFASICVAGTEVHFSPDTPVSVDGAAASVGALAIGQVVEVDAVGPRGALTARHIGIVHAAVGPVQKLDVPARRAVILGQRVIVPDGQMTTVRAAHAAGTAVRLSGLRRPNGDLYATHVAPAEPGDALRLSGTVTRMARGGVEIHGQPVELPEGLGRGLREGSTINVRGRLAGEVLRGEAVRILPELPFAHRPDRMLLEGFVDSRTLSRIRLAGQDIRFGSDTVFSRGTARDARQGERIVAVVRRDGAVLRAERITFVGGAGRAWDGTERPQPGSKGGEGKDREGHRGGGSNDASRDGRSNAGSGDSGRTELRTESEASGGTETRIRTETGAGGATETRERTESATGAKVERREKVDAGGTRVETVEKIDLPGGGKIEHIERIDASGRVERVERIDKVDRPARVERVERVDKPEKVEKIERVEKPEKIERVERPEKTDRPARPERPEKPERSGR